MSFTPKSLAWLWLAVLALCALTASGLLVGRQVLLLVLIGLATPAIVLAVSRGSWLRREDARP